MSAIRSTILFVLIGTILILAMIIIPNIFSSTTADAISTNVSNNTATNGSYNTANSLVKTTIYPVLYLLFGIIIVCIITAGIYKVLVR